MTLHQDYLDYSAIEESMVAVDAVFWAIGISSFGVDEETYSTIHVDYPASFVSKWLSVSGKPAISFHYIGSSDISEDSTAMWAREKVRAERTLFKLAEGTKLRVIAYRPDYIGPTEEEAHLGRMTGVLVRASKLRAARTSDKSSPQSTCFLFGGFFHGIQNVIDEPRAS